MIGAVHSCFSDQRPPRLRATRSWLRILALTSIAACASGPQARSLAPVALAEGDPDAAPNLQALPEMASGTTGNTARTHQGLLLARQTLDQAFPVAPSDRDYGSLQRWVDTIVVAWLEQRRAQTEATRERFLVEGEPSDAERIVSHAVIGLIHEDTARSLSSIPAPSELDSEPEIATMYRDMIRTQAEPFINAALGELRDCADDGSRGPEDMRAWARFCHARFDRLRERSASHDQASGKVASKAQ